MPYTPEITPDALTSIEKESSKIRGPFDEIDWQTNNDLREKEERGKKWLKEVAKTIEMYFFNPPPAGSRRNDIKTESLLGFHDT
jgi:hypothetical protein